MIAVTLCCHMCVETCGLETQYDVMLQNALYNGRVTVAWGLFWEEAGARNLAFFRVIVPCKVATAGEYLVCAACAAAVVPDATWFLLVPPCVLQ